MEHTSTRSSHQIKTAIRIQAAGGRKLRPIDELILYGAGLQQGGIRSKVYDQEYRKAEKAERVPDEATEVLKEIKARLAHYVYETKLQKEVRLTNKFGNCVQGAMSHAAFRAVFEECLLDLSLIHI